MKNFYIFQTHFLGQNPWKARKSVSLLSAKPTAILGTKLKLPRQRALGLESGQIIGRINLARARG